MRILTCQEFLQNYDRLIYENQSNENEIGTDEFSRKVDLAAIKAGKLAERGIDVTANVAGKISKAGIEGMVTLAHFMRRTKRENVKKALIILSILGLGYFGLTSLKSQGITDADIRDAKREIYIVKERDTLYKIAKDHQTTVPTLKEINGIDDPKLIKVGQQILLPEKK